MATCSFAGNTDMYGIGIRIGFYLQWFSALLARVLVPRDYRSHREEHPLKDEATGLRFSNNVFSAATFLALVILIAGNVSSLQVVEVYIVLLLTFGYSLALVPIYLWRLLTLGNPRWDPTRWPMTYPSAVESILTFLIVAGVASFQLWFWFVRVPQLDNLTCQEYGFLMTKVRLNLAAMRAVNILLYLTVLIACVIMLLRWGLERNKAKSKTRKRDRVSSDRRNFLRNLNILLGFAVAIIVVIATELTIKWNRIQSVNTLASAGQTIPFAIGVASFLRIFYVFWTKDPYKRKQTSDPGGSRPESPMSSKGFPGRQRRARRRQTSGSRRSRSESPMGSRAIPIPRISSPQVIQVIENDG